MSRITLSDLKKDMQRDTRRLVERAKKWQQLKPKYFGYPVGLPQLDDKVGGIEQGKLIILAGGPGSGKTSLAMQSLIHAAEFTRDNPAEVAPNTLHVFVSAEMSRLNLLQRTVTSRAGISLDALRHGQVSDEQLQQYEEQLTYLLSLPLLVVDAADPLTSEDVQIVAEGLTAEGLTLGIVAVDYLQHLNDEGANETIRLNLMLRRLSYVVQKTEASLLLLSQYSREKMKEKRKPRMEDLLGSGNLERTADAIWAIHDPESAFNSIAPGVTRKEVYVLKNRYGPAHEPGEAPFTFDFYKAQTLFVDPTVTPIDDMEYVNGLYVPRPTGARREDEEDEWASYGPTLKVVQ